MLTSDYDLKSSDIQQIASAEALTGLFTALGYDTGQRVPQTPAALGFPEALTREVTRVERLADQEQGTLQVYLVELKHVTVALTHALARAFRSRAGLFLLVLTTPDYERLDFTLLEPAPPEPGKAPTSGLNAPQLVLRPRLLSVDRRNPDPVAQRVLRRFSYTEVDAYYQWDKLRSAYGVAEWSEPLFNNRALFSDYYLNERLPQRPEWKEDPKPAYRELSRLLVEARQKYAGATEERVSTELLEPVFRALGWEFERAKGFADDGIDRPDYWLTSADVGEKSRINRQGREGRQENHNFVPGGEESAPKGYAADSIRIPCLTYAWDRTLDGPDEQRDAHTPRENPAQTVVSILENPVSAAAGWAVMTNGKVWRLYSAKAHSRATNYYEIDLEETLASPDLADAFRYFWLMFRAAAFDGGPQTTDDRPSSTVNGPSSFLDSLLSESASYAKALGERLKERVFEQVFPHFAEGFVQYMQQTSGFSENSEILDDTYHATLTLLYRLLFVLYAETRDLLPARETRGYWEISLDRMKKEIAANAGEIADLAPERLKKAYSATSTELYDRLNRLFRVIDKGEAELNVPMYNGGLFVTEVAKTSEVLETAEISDEDRAIRFLSRHKVPDRALALGLDFLTRDIDEKSQALAMIDYKSLGVRQLGSIYEGLLEFKLRLAREKMAVVAGKKGDEYVPYAEAQAKGLKIRQTGKGSGRTEFVIPRGGIYLENDKHERKASGSYYTPDYIVKYIVQNTVGPALEARTEALRPQFRAAQKAYLAAVERQRSFQQVGQKGDDPEKTAFTFAGLVDDLFDLRVLDPAMGSGHFLVEAVDFLTDRLLAFLNAFPWNPVTAALRQTRQTILEEMQKQGVSVDPARLTDVNLLKRHVLKRCIYGVDLNPMAVELAKVSLWLDCFTLGAPLSFLDHHLKPGNSLIGARIEEVRAAIEMAAEQERLEIPLLVGVMGGSQFAGVMMSVDLMRRVGELSDVTAAQVRESQAEYRKAADALAPYKRILDVYTSRWFGNTDTKFDQPAISFLRNESHLAWIQGKAALADLKPAARTVAETALQAARQKRFFHWELEFPEVFFGPSKASAQQIVMKENPGFDAVIGNPPYLNMDRVSPVISKYLSFTQAEINKGQSDLYYFFITLGAKLLKHGGSFGMITGRYWIESHFARGLRQFLLDQNVLNILVDFQNFSVFPEVGTKTSIIILCKHDTSSNFIIYQIAEQKIKVEAVKSELLSSRIGESVFRRMDLQIQQMSPESWVSVSTIATPITEKISKNAIPLGEIARVGMGMQTGLNDAFEVGLSEIEKKKLETIALVKVVSNEEIQRFNIIHNDRYWIYTEPLDNPEKQTPNCLNHLEIYRDKLEQRIGYKRGDCRWYQFSYPRHVDKFSLPKLIVPFIAPTNRFGVDIIGEIFSSSDSQVIFPEITNPDWLLFLSSVLNSKLLSWRFKSLGKPKDYRFEYSRAAIEKLPIRRITFSTPAPRREALAGEACALTAAGNAPALLGFVESRLSAQPEESDLVHDLLAHLAERMIDLNQQKQAEMKRFLGWLENLVKAKLDDLTGKSKLKNYLGDYQKAEPELPFGELEDILYKNKAKLGISLSDARLLSHLREEYEKSLSVLRPLKTSLSWTDSVIDQVVYRLYGLTEEEVRVVEGKG